MKRQTNYYSGIIKLHSRMQLTEVHVEAPNIIIAKEMVEYKYKYDLSHWEKPLELLPF